MFKSSNVSYAINSTYLAVNNMFENMKKTLFVGAGAFLVPVFYGVSFIEDSLVVKTTILAYLLLMALFCYMFFNVSKKYYLGKETPFYFSFILLGLLGGAIFSISFAEFYIQDDHSEYKVLKVMLNSAVNTFIWKLFFIFVIFMRFLMNKISKKEWFISEKKQQVFIVLFFIIIVCAHAISSVQFIINFIKD